MDILKTIGIESSKFNCSAYLVGGPVRDIVLGKKSKDLDIVVESKTKKNCIKKLTENLARTLKAKSFLYYKEFGTSTIFLRNGKSIDLAMARSEVYKKPGVLPVVRPSDIYSDLKRRDFTINSMAICLSEDKFGLLVDPNNGLDDIRKKQIRVLHKKSFVDDPTRILRAIRFSVRLDFKIEKETLGLLKESIKRNDLKNVSKERIKKEFLAVLVEKDTYKILKKFSEFGIFLFDLKLTKEKQYMLKNLNIGKNPVPLKLSILLLGEKINKIKSILKEMKLEREITNQIITVFRYISGDIIKNLPEWSKYFFKIAKIEKRKFFIDGNALIKLGFKPGPVFRKILSDVNKKNFSNYIQAEKYILRRYSPA